MIYVYEDLGFTVEIYNVCQAMANFNIFEIVSSNGENFFYENDCTDIFLADDCMSGTVKHDGVIRVCSSGVMAVSKK